MVSGLAGIGGGIYEVVTVEADRVGGELSRDLQYERECMVPDSLLGDWHILSALVPVGSSPLTADIAWEGTMMEITEDSVRFHRHDLVYPATYPGETIDYTISTYPATYSPDGQITINGLSLALFPKEDGTLLLCGNYIEIKILKD